MNEQAILYFVKYPTPGKVKTRLAKDLGEKEAAGLYRNLVEKNLKILNALGPVDILIYFDPAGKEKETKEWLNKNYIFWPQEGKDLGERIIHGFKMAFQNGYKKVLALGSDTLNLTKDIVAQGFEALQEKDVVIGPSKDGGYYLIGMKKDCPQLFGNIPWSTPNVLKQTAGKIYHSRLSVGLLPVLEDLDHKENLLALKA